VTEGLVAGRRAAHAALADRSLEPPVGDPEVPDPSVCPAKERARIQDAMTRLAGPLRDADHLAQLASVLASLDEPPEEAEPLTLADVETANIALVASAIATSAMMRTESRGCHRRDDAPEPSPSWDGHVEVRLVDGQVAAAFVPAGVPV
jgi:L-aspartate oxidase